MSTALMATCPYECGWSCAVEDEDDQKYEVRYHLEHFHDGAPEPPTSAQKQSSLCRHDGCEEQADVEGFCFYHARHAAPEAPPLPTPPVMKEELPVRTCEEVAGCTNPTVSDRGRYARVCAEHKDLVTERYRSRTNHASGSATSSEGPKQEAVKPPPADGHDEGNKPAPIASKPAPAQASRGTQNGTLASLAGRVDELELSCRNARTILDELERELAESIASLEEGIAKLRPPTSEPTPA